MNSYKKNSPKKRMFCFWLVEFTSVLVVKQRGVHLLMNSYSQLHSKISPKKRNFSPWFVLNCANYMKSVSFPFGS